MIAKAAVPSPASAAAAVCPAEPAEGGLRVAKKKKSGKESGRTRKRKCVPLQELEKKDEEAEALREACAMAQCEIEVLRAERKALRSEQRVLLHDRSHLEKRVGQLKRKLSWHENLRDHVQMTSRFGLYASKERGVEFPEWIILEGRNISLDLR